jgi:hypothetical protein
MLADSSLVNQHVEATSAAKGAAGHLPHQFLLSPGNDYPQRSKLWSAAGTAEHPVFASSVALTKNPARHFRQNLHEEPASIIPVVVS